MINGIDVGLEEVIRDHDITRNCPFCGESIDEDVCLGYDETNKAISLTYKCETDVLISIGSWKVDYRGDICKRTEIADLRRRADKLEETLQTQTDSE